MLTIVRFETRRTNCPMPRRVRRGHVRARVSNTGTGRPGIITLSPIKDDPRPSVIKSVVDGQPKGCIPTDPKSRSAAIVQTVSCLARHAIV